MKIYYAEKDVEQVNSRKKACEYMAAVAPQVKSLNRAIQANCKAGEFGGFTMGCREIPYLKGTYKVYFGEWRSGYEPYIEVSTRLVFQWLWDATRRAY